MKNLKQVITSGLSAIMMCCSVTGVASANEISNSKQISTDQFGNTITEIIFSQNAPTDSDSALEVGKSHLLALGFSKDWIAGMSDDEIKKYADISESTVTDSYLKLRGLTEEELLEKETIENSRGAEAYEDPCEFETISKEQYIRETQTSPLDTTSLDLDSGYVQMTVTCSKRTSLKSQYMVSGRYEWSKVPKTRGKDCFVLSTSNLALVPSTFYSVTKSSMDYYRYVALAGGIQSGKDSSLSYRDKIDAEHSGNGSWEYSGDGGYAVAHSFSSDLLPPAVMVTGTSATGKYYYDFKGYISFDGVVAQPNQKTNFNAFSTLHHNTKAYSGSISLSIPKSASISISPVDKYTTKQVATLVSYVP